MSQKIYGYWINKDEIIEVPTWGHEQVAYEILENKHGIEQYQIEDANANIYDVMFYLGYVRIVNEYQGDDGHRAQYWRGGKHSKLQKQFIKEAISTDHWDISDDEIETVRYAIQVEK